MLQLNSAQMAAATAHTQARFVGTLAAHAERFSPRLCAVAGAGATQRCAALALERASALGWREQHLVTFYLELMLTLGADFAFDPQFPWHGRPLAPTPLENSQTRACRLYADVQRWLAAVAGPGQAHALAALRRVANVATSSAPGGGGDLPHNLRAGLRAHYPEKSSACGDAALHAVAALARREAAAAQLPAEPGGWLIGVLMLSFGSGACADPMLPWLSAALHDDRIAGPEQRLQRLWRKLGTYARHAAAYLGVPG